jgi:hypothetical protein
MEVFERVAPWLVSTADDTEDRIRRALFKVGRDGLSARELSRKVSGVKPAVVHETAWAMVNRREVHVEKRRTAGRAAEVFRLPRFAAGIRSANIMNDPGSFIPLLEE